MLRSCICLGGRLRTAVGRVTRRKAEQLRRLPANRRRTTPTQLRKQSRSGSASTSQAVHTKSMQKWLKGNQKMSPKQVSALRQFDNMISSAQKRKEDMILQAIVRAQHDFKKQNDEVDEMEKAEINRSKFAQKIFAQNKKIAEAELQKIEHEKKAVVKTISREKELKKELRREAVLRQQEIAKAERERRKVPKVLIAKIRRENYKKQKETPYSEEEKQFFKMLRELEAKREAAINSAKQKIEENERLASERTAEKSFLEELKLIKEKRAAVINKIKEEAKADRERERKEMMEQKRLQQQQRLEEKQERRRQQQELMRQRREQRQMQREEKRRQLQLEKERKKEKEQLQVKQEQQHEANNLTDKMNLAQQATAETEVMQSGITMYTPQGDNANIVASTLELKKNESTGDVHADMEETNLTTSSNASKSKSQRKRRESSSQRKSSSASKTEDVKQSLTEVNSNNTDSDEVSHSDASQVIIAPTNTTDDGSVTRIIPLPASISNTTSAFPRTTPTSSLSSSEKEEQEQEESEKENSPSITPAAKHKYKKTSETKHSTSPADSNTSELTEAMKNYYNLLQHEKNRVLASSALSQPVIQSHTRMSAATHKRATSVTSSSRTTASATLSASAHGKRSGKRDSAHSARHSLSVVPHNELVKTPSASSSPSLRGSHGAIRGGQPNRVLRPSTVATWATQQNTSGLFRL